MNFNLGQFDPSVGLNSADDEAELLAELAALEGGDSASVASSSKALNRATKGPPAPKQPEAHKKSKAPAGKAAAPPAGLDMVADYTKAMSLAADPIASIGDINANMSDDDWENDDALMVTMR